MFFDKWFSELEFLVGQWRDALKGGVEERDLQNTYEHQIAEHFSPRYPDPEIFARRLIAIAGSVETDTGKVLDEIWFKHRPRADAKLNDLIFALSAFLLPFHNDPALLDRLRKTYNVRSLTPDYESDLFSPFSDPARGALAFYDKEWPSKSVRGGFGVKGGRSMVRFDIRPGTLGVCFGVVGSAQAAPTDHIDPMVQWLIRDIIGRSYDPRSIGIYVHTPWHATARRVSEEFDKVVGRLNRKTGEMDYSFTALANKPAGLDEAMSTMPNARRIERDDELRDVIQLYTKTLRANRNLIRRLILGPQRMPRLIGSR